MHMISLLNHPSLVPRLEHLPVPRVLLVYAYGF